MVKKLSFLLMILCVVSCGQNTKKNSVSTTESNDSIVVQTAKEAYVYGLPLVLMDITRKQMTNKDTTGKVAITAAPNTFVHLSKFPDASFQDVVRPNVDTYYSLAWLDLSKEPFVLSVPDSHGRYYMMPMLDAYTNVFASPGTRTTGNGKGDFLITGPQWTGTVPANMKQIEAPTNAVWLMGRTQVNSKADGDKVVIPLQHQYKLTPLSSWGKSYTPPTLTNDPSTPKGFPNTIVEQMDVEEYFNYLNQLLANFPPPAADSDILGKFESVGVGNGKTFDLKSFSTPVQQAISNFPKEVPAEFKQKLAEANGLENGWNISRTKMGSYGTDYQLRAYIAFIGLGANLPEDAIYPMTSVDASGNLLNGSNKYLIHYDKGQTPPANAFWSITMYDTNGHLIENPINRYAIGDRDKLKFNADGSVDIYIQNISPGKDKESNWLPAPSGDFNLCMRVYYPKEEMINGSWKITPVKKVE